MSKSYESLESKCMMQENEIKELRKLKAAVEKLEEVAKTKDHYTFTFGFASVYRTEKEDLKNTFHAGLEKFGERKCNLLSPSLSTALIKLSEKL